MRQTMFFLSSIRKYRKITPLLLQQRHVRTYMLVCITKGDGILIINHTRYQVSPSQLFWLTPGMTITATTHSNEIEYYILVLDPITVTKQNGNWQISDLLDASSVLLTDTIHLQNPRHTLERIQQLYAQVSGSNASLPDWSSQLHFQEFYSSMMQDLLTQSGISHTSNSIEQSVQYIHNHFHKHITLKTLSEITKLTPGSYSRSFKKAMGISPIEYVTKLRVDSAKEKLSQSNYTIKDVSSLVGYNNEFYFSRIFKKTVGIAPTLYIKRQHLKVAVISCYGYHDNLNSLGIEPVISANCFRYPGMNEAEHKVLVSSQLDEVRRMKPDLIIGDYYHRDFYHLLKPIAPTVYLKHHSDWRMNHRNLAEIFGCEKEAELNIKQVEMRTAETNRQLKHSIGTRTVTIMRITHNTVRIQGTVIHPLNCFFYSELGLRSGNVSPRNKSNIELQPEVLPHMQSDYLFIQKHPLLAGNEHIFSRLQNTSSWGSCEAVLNNKIQFIPNWFAMSWTTIGRNQIIDELIEV